MKMHFARLIFCHVPKTAGSSITRLLRDNWPGPHALDVFEQDDCGADLSHAMRDSAMLAGHLSHANVLRAMDDGGIDAFKLTSLRNPIDHVLSTYYHIQAYAGDALSGDGRVRALKDAASGMSLLEWMAGRARDLDGFETMFDNPQVRMILDKRTGPLTIADAQEAIAIMGRFDGVILFERLRESVFAVMAALGLDPGSSLPRLMTNPSKERSVMTLSRTEMQAMMALTRYDALLYDVISTSWCAKLGTMSIAMPKAQPTAAPEVLLSDVLRTSNAQKIEGGVVGETIQMRGDSLFLHPPHGDAGALRILSADFPASGQNSFSTELSLEHESAPMVEVSMTIRDGDKVVCAFTTGVTPAARVPITLRFAPIMGRCSVDLDVRTLDPQGANNFAWLMMWRAVFSG